MTEILIKLAPIFIGFGVTFAAKKAGWVRAELGGKLLKFALYVTIPALIFASVSRVGFTKHLLIFPALSWIVVGITFVIVLPIAKRLRLKKATEGTFRTAPMTMNSGFVLPFLLATFGGEGVTRVVLFNAGFNPLLLLGVYGVAASYNPGNHRKRDVLKRILILPPLWALIAGLLVNVSDTSVAAGVIDTLEWIGGLTIFLTIAALGLLFNPRRIRLDKTLGILGLRMGIGLIIGLSIAAVLHLEPIDRAAVIALAAAPIGFNLLTFASVEKLDEELAASAVSLSLLAGLILMPLIIILSV